MLTGCQVSDVDSAKEAMRKLLARGPGCVVVTLGAGGVVFSGWGSHERDSATITHIPAETVATVDTTVSPSPESHSYFCAASLTCDLCMASVVHS